MTHGEQHYQLRNAIDFKAELDHIHAVFKQNTIPRMDREDANRYYTKKINKEFERLGYKAQETAEDIYTPEYRLLGFDCVDDMYDYYEAVKHKWELLSA